MPRVGAGRKERYTARMNADAPAETSTLPPETTAWVLASGKIGHEVHCLGIARELGLEPQIREVRPRAPFAWLSPWGPVDPRDSARRSGSLLAPPFPDLVFAAGRSTVPYLRHLRRASGGRVFTVFLQDPRTGPNTADVIWVPEHDRLRGKNVLVTLTSPHPLRPHVLAAARRDPDPRIAALPTPRVALVLGGPSAHHRFEGKDLSALVKIAVDAAAAGRGVMVTPSRRSPPELVTGIAEALRVAGLQDRAFIWDGTGANPYAQILAHADTVVVTGDSVNMVGEALVTGAPVQVYEPTGGHPKIAGFIDRLVTDGHVRRWSGALESWATRPVDVTAEIATEIARRYRAARGLASPVL